MTYSRYAVYVAPPPDTPWARFATGWLGWDMHRGAACARPDLPDLARPLDEIVATPARYGLHATLKPPFRLPPDRSEADLITAFDCVCVRSARVELAAPRITRLGRFLALCAFGDTSGIDALAASTVRDLDCFRAPPTTDEIARRRPDLLTPAQRENLTRWGYPHVMDQFRFHITLTGRLPKADLSEVEATLNSQLDPLLPERIVIGDLVLAGEDQNGFFHALRRTPLAG